MDIDIICPLYNGEEYIEDLNRSLLKQKKVNINKIFYILTESTDKTEQILKKKNIAYEMIKKEDFSHSLVREKKALQSKADILVFISQDISIEREDWLYELVNPIVIGEADASYSRQLTKYNNIEKYTREKNYPEQSFLKTKKDIETLGLTTFFFSDASSAIRREVFCKLNGYDHKDLPINENMYIAYKLIMEGYTIKYCATSLVYHSHKFRLRELYKRYKLTGIFFKQNKELDQFKTTASGGGLALYILKRALKEKNIKVLLRYPFDMSARLFGMKAGKKSEKKQKS